MILTPYFDRMMQLPEQARQVMCPPPRPYMDEWMESGEYILPPETSDVHGAYSFEYTPFLRDPMRKLSRGPVRVGIEACTQIGKTVCMNAAYGYCIRYRLGPILLIMPRREDVESRIETRLVPMFRASPMLMREVPGGDLRNINIGKQTVFANGVICFLAWAGSPAAMSDKPIRVALIDEPGKFKILAETGENPFDLIDNRQRSYNLQAITFYVTSPQTAGDLSDKQFRAGSDGRLWVPCHGCGNWHAIGATEETLVIGKDKNGNFYEPEAYTERNAPCWYQCPHCKKRWSETHRAQAIARYKWVHKTQQMTAKGLIIGDEPMTRHWTYRANSMMIHPRFWSVKKEAKEFVKAQLELRAGSVAQLMNYRRNQQGCPWEETIKTVSDEAMMSRILPDLHRRCVPVGAKMLVASADYHEDFDGNKRIDFEVRAFGVDLINWVVLAGTVETWENLEVQLWGPFPWAADCDEEELMVTTVFADSGYKADDVYGWCGQYPGWAWPVKGVERQMKPLDVKSMEDIHEKRRKKGKRRMAAAAIKGQQLVLIHQGFFSDQITSWVDPDQTTRGSTHFYNEVLDDTAGRYFKEFRGMHRVKVVRNGFHLWTWRALNDSTPVHFHDLPRYSAAAGFFNKANLLQSALSAVPPAMAARSQKPVRLSEKPRRYR